MHARTGFVVASLVLAVLGSAVAAAQPPATATDPNAPGGEPAVDTQTDQGQAPATEQNTDQTEKKTDAKTKKDKKKKKEKSAKTESRGPSLTQLEDIEVEADRPLSAASSQVIRARDFALRPHSTTQEILNNVPGLMVVQHQGGGKAVQYLIRGFDADHGTDFALFTDGIPVNLVSHAHGQGYADLNYLIPETVKDLELFKGPYFVDLGDFATAGALKIATKDEYQQNFALAEGGYFATQRYVLGASPRLDWMKTLLTAEAYFSNGPFVNPQNYARYNLFTKFTLEPVPDSRLSMLGSLYRGDWDASGQIPVRAIGNQPGQIGRFGSLDPYEGGTSDRENLSVQYTQSPDPTQTFDAQLWGAHYDLKLYSDFTFFKTTGLRFVGLPNGGYVDTCAGGFNPDTGTCGPVDPNANYIPGDGIRQQDQGRWFFGGHATWTKFWSLFSVPYVGEVPMQTQLGFQMRHDQTVVSLDPQVHRHIFYMVNDSGIDESSVSGFWGQQFFFTEWARLEAGVRGDVFFFDVTNRLPEQAPDRNYVPEPSAGTATKGLASPKVNLVLGPWQNTELYLNYGNGFHSNDARSVVTTGLSGLTVANGYEIGSRTRQFDRLDVASALWLIDLQSELVFNGDEGTFEASGPTRRWGVDFETRYEFTNWLFGDLDLTYADPRFKNGDAIPLAPIVVLNTGLTAEFPNGFAAALRLRHYSSVPANEDRTIFTQPWTLLDILLRYRWRNVEASLSFINTTDTAWNEAQFADNTCLRGEEGSGQPCPTTGSLPTFPNPNPPPTTGNFAQGIEGLTITPGTPFAIRGGLQIFF